ncbi:T-cell receptor gamma chain C region DFL12, partial [Buceros rhinoceros silvestris]
IHWYQQKENKAPERILYFSGAKVVVDAAFQANRYSVEKVFSRKLYILTINDVTPDDTATYYCAYWHEHRKIFGSGTKLIISNKANSAPTNAEILQTEHGNQITYVCLIEKFYPEVIRVKWTDDNKKEVTDKVVKGDAWKATKEDEYSISSWLTVPAENKGKNYNCEYEHEAQQGLLPTQVLHVTEATPQECITETYRGNGTVYNRDHLMHRTAYLVYLILLLKSSMYYLIVLFFIYR